MTVIAEAHRKKTLRILYGAMFFFSFHCYIFLYIQSDFISRFIPESALVLIYGVGAIISLATLFAVPKIFGHISDRRFTVWLIIIEALLCFVLAFSNFAPLIIIAFILQQALIPVLSFALDVLIENSSERSDTGLIRGLAFTASNIALVASPLLAAYIGSKFGFGSIFYISNIFLIPFLIATLSLRRKMHEPTYHTQSIVVTIKNLFKNPSVRHRDIQLIFMVNLTLQIFYTWMVIYSPLYLLHQGFNWDQIGLIFSIMLLPFLIFELPLGAFADKYFGEKEFMIVGFIVLAISTISLSFIHSPSIAIWAFALFATRIGASFIEIMSETYFFKQVGHMDAPVISLFRFTRPISLLIAPIMAAFTIMLTGETFAFIILGLLMLFGLRFVYPLVDTL